MTPEEHTLNTLWAKLKLNCWVKAFKGFKVLLNI